MECVLDSSSPYPWPWHGVFEPKRSALIVTHDGLKHLPGGVTWQHLEQVMAAARAAGMTLVSLPPAKGLSAGSIAPEMFQVVVPRPHIGGFCGTDLDFQLRSRGLTDLVFAGFPLEIGADTTMREANDLGYECLALLDCCTGVTVETLAGALHSIEMSGGIFGAVASTSALLVLLAALPAATIQTQIAKDVA
jgi:hypothetical protein